MIEFKQIICPVDFSESSVRALRLCGGARTLVRRAADRAARCADFEPMQVRGDLGDPVRS